VGEGRWAADADHDQRGPPREVTYCARKPGEQRVLMTVELSRTGKVVGARRG